MWSGNTAGCLHVAFLQAKSLEIASIWAENNTGKGATVAYISGALHIAISNTTLKANTAFQGSAGFLIFPQSTGPSSAFIANCSIWQNRNYGLSTIAFRDFGGRMAVSLSALLQIEVINTEFVNNTGEMAGTGLGLYDSVPIGEVRMENCSFVGNNNRQAGAGLSLAFTKGTFKVVDCLFQANHASHGSALHTRHLSSQEFPALLSLSHCIFSENTGGSVVEMDGGSSFPSIHSEGLLFSANQSPGFAITAGELLDIGSNYVGNIALKGSGIHAISNSKVVLRDCEMSGNKGDYGGVVYISSKSAFTLYNCSAGDNSARVVGGVAYVDQSSTLIISSSHLVGNSANKKGSVVFSLYGQIAIVNSWLLNNFAGAYGSVYASDSSLRLSNTTLANNTAAGSSPGIVGSQTSIQVADCQFLAQSSVNGAMFLLDQSQMTVNSSLFSGCSAMSSGGCIFASTSDVTIVESAVSQAWSAAGAFINLAQNSNLTLISVSVIDTTSPAMLGAILATGGIVTITSSSFSNTNGGAVYVQGTILTLTSSSFNRASGVSGGAIFVLSSLTNVHKCQFSGNSASMGGAIYAAALAPTPVTIQNSIFEGNIAPLAGAYYSESANSHVEGNIFISNQAIEVPGFSGSGSGGALVFSCVLQGSCQNVLKGNSFERNRAVLRGGAVLWQHSFPLFINNTFSNNTAAYGTDIASYAIRLMLVGMDLQTKPYQNESVRPPLALVVENVGSGYVFDGLVRLGLFDHQGQLLNMDSSSGAEIVVPTYSNLTIFGSVKAMASHGVFTFSQFTLTAKPGTSQDAFITTPAIRMQPLSAYDLSIAQDTLVVRFTFRECLMGEYLQHDKCGVCPSGTYSFSPYEPCTACPKGAICYGNYTMVPEQGYWRADIFSPTFFSCDNFDACIGSPASNISLQGLCATGYTGNLCATCEKDYSLSGKNNCSKCPSLFVNCVITSLVALLALFFLAIAIFIAIRSAARPNSELAIYVKILMNYTQMMIIAASLNMRWPSYTSSFLNAQIMVGNAAEQVFSVDCLLQKVYSEQLLFVKVTITSILPVALMALGVLTWLLIAICKPISLFKEKLVSTFVMILFILHTTITKTEFSVFPCKELKPDQLWLERDLNQRCWSPQHIRFIQTVALPSIVVWVAGLPMVCLLYIHRRRIALHSPSVQMQYSFLYKGYQRSRYFWEFVILYRKIALVMALVFLASFSPAIQAQTILAILLFSVIFQIYIQPFNIAIMNTLEAKSILASAITIYCGLYYESAALGINYTDSPTKVVLFLVILASNGYFLASWVARILPVLLSSLSALLFRWKKYQNAKRAVAPELYIEEERSISASHSRLSAVFRPPNNTELFPPTLKPNSSVQLTN